MDIPLVTTQSEINPFIRVNLSRGRYQLLTENAIYSYGDLYDNFFEAFKFLELDNRNVEEVLILGFGLASIPYMLENNFKKNYYYTAVEIDEKILELAHQFVTKDLRSPIDFVCTDAESFVFVTEQTFDVICVDIFLDEVIPEQFRTTDFLVRLSELLNPEGIIIFNTLYLSTEDKIGTDEFVQHVFKKVFPGMRSIVTKSNRMLFNR